MKQDSTGGDSDTKVDADSRNATATLLHFNQIYWERLNYHREKEYRIFVWTSAILLGGIAALVVSKQGEMPIYLRYGALGRVGASFALLVWTGLSVVLQVRERNFGNAYVAVIVRISQLLGGFDEGRTGDGQSALPKEWEAWTSETRTNICGMLKRNYIPVTCTLGAFAVVLLWVQ
ncbi:MAG: hypothetical protein GX575_01050 [Candidatus Anammoximicrobium sp.]|nr:hypothetical protein [Candidatus Anammoximicrobium sp.]